MTEQDSKARYERLIRTIQYNSIDVGRPCCHEATVRLALVSHGDVELEEYARSLRAACENGDVVCADGWVCYPVDRQMAVDAIQHATDGSQEPPREFIAGCNSLMATL